MEALVLKTYGFGLLVVLCTTILVNLPASNLSEDMIDKSIITSTVNVQAESFGQSLCP